MISSLLLLLLPFWQDMHVTSVNADTRRTEVIYYPTREEALSKGFRESPNYLDLNGVWDFKYYDDHRLMPESNKPSAWDSINVPGNWEVQGWGTAIYTNQPYDFWPSNPQPPMLPEAVPAALYHRSFTVPSSWDGREVFLNLCGTKSGTYVYVNGKEIGYSEDSKSLARFRITDALKAGDNELTLRIYRYTTASFLEDQDFWRLSGIERDVYLSSEGRDTGFDFSVVSTLAEDLETGIFSLRMKADAPTEVSYELLDKDGKAVADASFEFSGRMNSVAESIPSVRRWSAETPELYTLLLRVNGEYTRFHVGFRRIEIKTVKDVDKDVKALLINGQPVKFKGVNLHEHNPYTGHYVNRENILEDLTLMRLANINAIRTCHYPQPREFYELCDSLGFYVYDETNIESHGMGYKLDRTLGNNPDWYEKHLDRTLNLYRRTANYPCVTILSLGNEAGNGQNFYNTYKVLKELEKDGMNRPVVYERAEYEWNTDMIVPQYPGAEWFRRMGEKYAERPVCPSEYAHAMGNSTGSLDYQWDAIYAHTHLQGGYIWDWVDQGLYDEERGWTYGGDYGENQPSDANFCCNGIVNPDREPHPGYYEVKHVYQDVTITGTDVQNGLFELFNRYYFKDLSDYAITWWVERDGKRPWYWRKHKLELNAAPQTGESFSLRLPNMKKGSEYRIFFEVSAKRDLPLVAKGTVLAFDEILLQDRLEKKDRKVKGSIEVNDGGSFVTVRSNKVELCFDKTEGIVKSWKVGGKDLIDPTFGLKPNFWRAPNDNDYGNSEPLRAQRYKQPFLPSSVNASVIDGKAVIKLTGNGVRASETYTVFPDGTIKVEVETAGVGTIPQYRWYRVEIPRLGFRFRVPDEAFTYFGRGPVENYWDRSSGTFKSIWSSSAEDEFYPYVRPQETGHHTETSWLQIGGLSVLEGAEPFEFSVLRMSVEDLDCENNVDRPYQWNYFSADEDHSDAAGRNRIRRQTHLNDIPVRDFTEVCIDYHMTGVGGYDSWGSKPEDDRALWADESYSYSFVLCPGKNAKKLIKYEI